MTAVRTISRSELPAPPQIPTVLAALDTAARVTLERARDAAVPAYRAIEPARSTRLRTATTGRILKTPVGLQLIIGPTRRVRYPGGRTGRSATGGVSAVEVFRFVDQGTGLFGPKRRAIRRRRGGPFMLPGGIATPRIAGQRPQHLLERGSRTIDPIITGIIEQGAGRAAQAVEEVL